MKIAAPSTLLWTSTLRPDGTPVRVVFVVAGLTAPRNGRIVSALTAATGR